MIDFSNPSGPVMSSPRARAARTSSATAAPSAAVAPEEHSFFGSFGFELTPEILSAITAQPSPPTPSARRARNTVQRTVQYEEPFSGVAATVPPRACSRGAMACAWTADCPCQPGSATHGRRGVACLRPHADPLVGDVPPEAAAVSGAWGTVGVMTASAGQPESGGTSPRGKSADDLLGMYKLAYEEGKRTVDDQIAELDSIRGKSVQYLAFLGAATAFLVGTGLSYADRSKGVFVTAAVATMLSGLALSLCLSILTASRPPWPTPKRDSWERWAFRMSPGNLLGWIESDVGRPTEVQFYRALAQKLEIMATENDPIMEKIRRRYYWFLASGVGQLIAWTTLAWLYG